MQVLQKQAINIDFTNVSYSIGRRKPIQILKEINGDFRSGSLIGILGPSGAGKSTLLNVLAGYIDSDRVRGQIKVNGETRNMRKFRKVSCYIMQQDVVQHQLSVTEIMMLAANLKLGDRFTTVEKRKIINTVIGIIGLRGCLETRTENLSGGQTKRLAVALELISNPPAMFLDEPTTGLDNVVAKQCIEVLKTLANQGRTIICTIHQPPNSLLNFFDQVYFMANGRCVYSGSVSQIIPFLEDVGMRCPTNYNPADYIVELASNSTQSVEILANATDNGLLTRRDSKEGKTNLHLHKQTTTDNLFATRFPTTNDFSNSYTAQVCILCRRMFIQTRRNKMALTIQLVHHVLSSVSMGFSFFGIGNNASEAVAAFKFFLVVMVFYCYTYIMSPILLFPFERELIRREYFNRWYSIKAYYTALTLSNLPQIILFSVIFNVIIYTLSDQPLDITRFFSFNVVCLLVSLASHRFGIMIGSIFDSLTGACVGSCIGMYLILMCMHGMGDGDTLPTFVKTLMLTTYPRHGLIGISLAVLQDRPLLKCEADFCFVNHPEELLHLMGVGDANLPFTVVILVIFVIIYEIAAFVALKWKVSPNSTRLLKYLFYRYL